MILLFYIFFQFIENWALQYERMLGEHSPYDFLVA